MIPFIANMSRNQEGIESSIKKITENGTYDTLAVNKVKVNVKDGQPGPEPEPGPIEVTVDQVKQMFESLGSDESYYIFEYNQDYVCHCSSDEMIVLWEAMDSELYMNLVNDIQEIGQPWFSVNNLMIDASNTSGSYKMGVEAKFPDDTLGLIFGTALLIDMETGSDVIEIQGWPEGIEIEFKFNRPSGN